ncbi:DUF3788 domain-containing protein [Ruminiclostridium herbifermentans]|uniref:DUF3788 domain-containing protein n=1 Tax=Ruminiclostridium herbifermentans TaxID=2488810 RepID=A0A4V6ENB9_9FIRM|nr:DUF3788 domain-containing protein [Ruminiclostridium herbifermentans]QNU65679.1 DUF3788 domain-containing protein [Ruminiclostridium herbifermentans]
MQWHEIFPQDTQPTMEDIVEYIGGEAKQLWQELMEYIEEKYKAKPKLTYSCCSGKPGWNVKFQKSGQSLGTLYPEENSFSVLLVISYKLEQKMEAILPALTDNIAEIYRHAGDYMKIGKWVMFQVKDLATLEDYKKLISVKLSPKSSK